MAFTAKDVKELREMTGCGMMDCRKLLQKQTVTRIRLLNI